MHANDTARARQGQSLDDLASDIQILAGRISALSKAADEAIDYADNDPKKRERLDHVYHFLTLIGQAAAQLKLCGEAVELAPKVPA